MLRNLRSLQLFSIDASVIFSSEKSKDIAIFFDLWHDGFCGYDHDGFCGYDIVASKIIDKLN